MDWLDERATVRRRAPLKKRAIAFLVSSMLEFVESAPADLTHPTLTFFVHSEICSTSWRQSHKNLP